MSDHTSYVAQLFGELLEPLHLTPFTGFLHVVAGSGRRNGLLDYRCGGTTGLQRFSSTRKTITNALTLAASIPSCRTPVVTARSYLALTPNFLLVFNQQHSGAGRKNNKHTELFVAWEYVHTAAAMAGRRRAMGERGRARAGNDENRLVVATR